MKGVHIKMIINGVNDMNRNLSVNVAGVDTQDISSARLKAMKRSGQVECETCANREYKDGSDEVNVSFKIIVFLLFNQSIFIFHNSISCHILRTEPEISRLS
jgi:hypothetical protein